MTTLRRNTALTTILAAISLVPVIAAESNVDRTAQAIDAAASATFGEWRVSPILDGAWAVPGDPTEPSFDDSAWHTTRVGDPIPLGKCWLRKTVVLPAQVYGAPVRGPLTLQLNLSRPVDVWVNGQSRGHFQDPFDPIALDADAAPGRKFVIALRLPTTGRDISGRENAPLLLRRADFLLRDCETARRELADFALSLRVGQRLLSLDTYQANSRVKEDPGIDRSTFDKTERRRLDDLLQSLAAQVDVEALGNGSFDKYRASVAAVRGQLAPIRAFAKRFTIYLDSNAHIDAAWLWREKETVEVVKNTFSSVLNIMNSRRDFVFTQSSAAYYDWMERYYPDLFKAILPRIKEGRWEVVGGLWVEPDCNLPGGESWTRQLLYGKRYFRQKLGVDVKIAWNPDSFGYNWNIPMLCSHAGIDAFITQKINWNCVNVFPYRVFWWQSPDGSRLLTYFPFSYDSLVDDPYGLVDWLRQFEANSGLPKMALMFGVGDHGGGPSMEMLERLDHYASMDIYPNVEHGTAARYLTWLKQQNLTALPVWNDELFLETHEGTLTTQAKMKESNRSSEVLLTNAEKFSTLASLSGRQYDAARLGEAWRDVLFNQFHDILPGSGIHEIYIDATERYRRAKSLGEFELNGSLQQIARNADTSTVTHGRPVVVFNPLAWERTDLVKVELLEGDLSEYAVFDKKGTPLPSQMETRDNLHRAVLFVAARIPALGYDVYELRKQAASGAAAALKASPSSLENNLFSVTLDPTSGSLSSIRDKRVGKELLSGPGNQLQLLEDHPITWDAWNLGFTGVTYPSKLAKVEVVERGPVKATLRVTRTYLKPGVKKEFPTDDFPSSFFTQDISLYAGLDRIDFRTAVDWWEDHTMLKVAFPLTVSDRAATYEIPYGSIRRSTGTTDRFDRAKTEVAAEHWADLSQDDYGVALLNRAKYGYEIKGQLMRLSLLRSPTFPDPLADRGKHSIDYSLFPHQGRVETSRTVARGYEYNNPLIAVLTTSHKGTAPAAHSFVSLAPANLVLTTMKKAEDSGAWIVQWYDAQGVDSEARLKLPRAPSKVVQSDFMEADGAPLVVHGSVVTVPTKKHSVVTVKVYFPEGR
jgi:alpha-mannosidase